MSTKEPKPASHCENNYKDVESKSLAEHLLSKHRRAIPKFDSVDKWPNIDGTIEFRDESNSFLGKFEAQVKTLSQDHNFKYKIPVTFIAYCDQVAILPVLLLLVDNNEEKVYWIHMSKELIDKTNYNEYAQKSAVTHYFNESDFFDKHHKDYINHWEKILLKCRNIKKLSDSISEFIIKSDLDISLFQDIYQAGLKQIVIVHDDGSKFQKLKSFSNLNKNSVQLNENKVSSDKEMDRIFKTNIYNSNYDLLLSNVSLAIERREHLGNDTVLICLSNKNQIDAFVHLNFELVIKNMKVLSTKINFSAMHKDRAVDQLMFLKFADKLKENDKLIAYDIDSGISFFEGTVNFQDADDFTKEEIDFIKNIVEIERKLNIHIKLPEKSELQDIVDINNLYKIITTGKLELPEMTMTNTFEKSISNSGFSNDSIFLFSFTSCDKFEVFDMEIDLGEQLYVLSHTQITDLQEKQLTIKSVEGSKNIIIYKRFYGEYSLDEILQREGVGIISK